MRARGRRGPPGAGWSWPYRGSALRPGDPLLQGLRSVERSLSLGANNPAAAPLQPPGEEGTETRDHTCWGGVDPLGFRPGSNCRRPHRGAVPAITTEDPEQSGGRDEIRTDLVEYLIVVVPSRDALGAIGSALTSLVENAKIRILDLVVLERDATGAVTVVEVESIGSMAALRDLDIEVGGMLTEHDLELASLALTPGMPGVVLVTEDLWAKSLSTTARRAGGQIVAGERIPASRVEAALGNATQAMDDTGNG